MKKVFVAIVSILLVISLVSCASHEDFDKVKRSTTTFIDAVLENDYETAYSMTSDISEEDFEVAFPKIVEYLANVEEYTLTQTSWYSNFDNGVSSITASYKLTSGEDTYEVTVSAIKGSDKLSSFNVTLISNAGTDDTSASKV